MQFRIPQFINVEDKIFGPFTFKQFLYILGSGGFAFVIWTFVTIRIIAIVLIIPVSGLFLSLAFVKINSRPLIDVLENAFNFYLGQKIFVWQQPKAKVAVKLDANIADTIEKTNKKIMIPKLKNGRLHELSFGLDVLDRNVEDRNNL